MGYAAARSLPPAALLACLPVPAHAEGGLVDQVERLEGEAGATELQAHYIQAWGPGPTRAAVNMTLEHGLSDNLQIGVEIEGERMGAESLSVESLSYQLKWTLLDPAAAPLGFGIQPSLELDPQTGHWGSETVFIAEALVGQIDLAANLVLAAEPGNWNDISTTWALRGDHSVNERVILGLEAGGALSGEEAGSHFIGPVLLSRLGEDGPAFEAGLFAPLTRDAPDIQFRLATEWEF